MTFYAPELIEFTLNAICEETTVDMLRAASWSLAVFSGFSLPDFEDQVRAVLLAAS